MGHHKDNDELRESRLEEDLRRQEDRDGTAAGDDDLGSQDERRIEGAERE